MENYGWRESGYPKITFTLSGSEQASVSTEGFDLICLV